MGWASKRKMPHILFLLQPDGDRFRFTVDSTSQGKLSPKQREFYEENGFLVVPNLVDHKLIDDCRQRFLDIVDGVVDAGAILKMKDLSLKAVQGLPNERVYNKIQDFVWDEVLAQYIQLPEVLDYVQCFTGPNIRAVHTMLINKPPDSGSRTSRHPMHQDLHYFPFRSVSLSLSLCLSLSLSLYLCSLMIFE